MPYKDYTYAKDRMRAKYQALSPEQKKEHIKACSTRRRKRRQELVDDFGGKCLKCNFSDPRALQFDHVKGDGPGHNATYDREKLWKEIRREPYRFQLLCANCNTIKRFENGELN